MNFKKRRIRKTTEKTIFEEDTVEFEFKSAFWNFISKLFHKE